MQQSPTTAPPPAQRNQPIVLVVDDSRTIRQVMREALESTGFTVEEAEDGARALSLFPHLRPDIVLLDVLMPGMDGFDTCAALRWLPEGERTPIVFMTSINDIDAINRAYEVGATDFVTKPVNWTILSHRLRYILRASQAIQEVHNSKEALRKAYDDLEVRVAERTAALQFSTDLLKLEIRERGRAKEALRQSEQYFRSLIENASDMITVLNEEGKIHYQSPAVTTMLGYFAENLIGKSILSLIHPHDLSTVSQTFTQIRQQPGVPIAAEFRLQHQDGSWRIVEAIGTSLPEEKGAVRIVVNSRDITARRWAEEALRSSEERYRALTENMRDLLCEIDRDARYIYLSPNYPDVLGYEPNELLGHSLFDFIHAEDRPRLLTELNSGTAQLVFRCRHKSGQWRWLESTTKAYLTPQQEFRIVVVSRDVTDRKKVEDDLSLRDRAIASTSEGICITDPLRPENPIIYVNAAFERLTGYTRDELIGQNCRILQGPETELAATEKIRTAVHNQHECVVELRNYRKDGSPFWNRLAITPVRNAAGQVTHYIGVQSDISERKEMERLKDELVSTVSHELRTPLTSLRGFAELMLKRTFSPAKQREFLNIIHNESLRLTNLINDFLDLQRIEAGHQTYSFENTPLEPLLRETVAVFSTEKEPHSLAIEVQHALPLVHIDAARIRQVLVNLLSNALKFSPRGGIITIGASVESDAVKVWVADQGIGIPQEAIPSLFKKFFRVDNRDTKSIGGTGLGLALVREIVKAHGGYVWVESQVGVGTTFFFTLPISESPTTTDATAQERTAVQARETKSG